MNSEASMAVRAGERLAVVENQMTTINKKMDALDSSVGALHTKIDTLVTTFHENFVSKGEFEEWKKNRWYERTLIIILTAAITGLVAFFLRQNGVS